MQFLARHVGRWPIALGCVVLLATVVLLPGLGSSGLWEPQERQLSDKVAPREQLAKQQAAAETPPPAPPKDGCLRIPPKDPVARSLTNRAIQYGRDVDDSDAGRRLPLALLGLLTVVASAGIAMRLAGPRAGILTALVLLSMPLLVLQSRQLTSEIGTAAGGALVLYGLVALGRGTSVLALVESAVALVALAGGLVLGFVAGGALFGTLVPLGAFAAAHGLGYRIFATVGRATRCQGIRIGKRLHWRWAIGRDYAMPASEVPLAEQITAAVVTVGAIAVLAWLAYQLYSLKDPQPGMIPPQREVFGHAIVSTGCWSDALGALWRPEDDLRYVYDSTFEQIAYGTFPWGVLGPVAMMALLMSPDRGRRRAGALTLAWASAAWIACEAFQRKVGFSLWAGFPALAIAIGAWVDGMLAGARRGDHEAVPRGAILVAMFFAVAVLDLGKDLQSFSERLTSLLVGADAITYPTASRLLFVPTKLWVLVLGLVVALGFAAMMVGLARGNVRSLVTRIGAGAALGGTVIFAAFWSFAWQPKLASHLSSKAMFDMYSDLARPGDALVIMGDMGDAPYDYAPGAKPEKVSTREQVVTALGRDTRVFAITPQTELCQLHREVGGKPYFVIDDRNVRSLLLSNKVDGAEDKNPLRTAIVHAEPKTIPLRPKARIVFDSRIELLGWDMPKVVGRGEKFEVKMFYKVLQPVGGVWKVLFHFDGGLRFNGDHEPINGRCQTSTWQQGDYIIDTYTVTAGGGAFAQGRYEVWTGFFTGTAPNWKNMPVSEAPGDMRDNADRVKITTIDLD